MHEAAVETTAPGGATKLTRDEARQRFFALGAEWYGLLQTRNRTGRADEIEAEAVALLRDNKAVLPSLSALRRDGANVAFFPSTVDSLWRRAFPPTVDDVARGRTEWDLLHDVAERVTKLSHAGSAAESEGLRKAAVTFFNVWLTSSDDVDARLRAEARAVLRKS